MRTVSLKDSRIGATFALALACAGGALGQAPTKFDVYTAVNSDKLKSLPDAVKSTVNLPAQAQTVFLGRIPFNGTDVDRPDPVQQAGALPTSTTATGLGFEGLGNNANGFTVQYAPPDTNGAVGPTQYIQWVNTSFAVFDKATGTRLMGPAPANALWKGFGGGCETNNDGDPIVLFDKVAQRWIFTQFSVSTKPYLQCFAISAGPDATTGTYTRFAFSFGNTDFPDYPKMGIWQNAYYLSFNIFRNGFRFSGPRACAVDRTAALGGATPTMICTQLSSSTGSILPADVDGSAQPPSGAPEYFIAYGSNVLQVYKFSPNFASASSSTFTGPTNVAVASFTRACSGGTCIPQPGTNQNLDSLADRLMYRLAYRNQGTTGEYLVVNHSVKTSTAASGIRWYQLKADPATRNLSVAQQGTYSPDASSRWMGSIAMDKCGNIAVGYSVSDASATYPSIRVTGRTPTDPAGQLQTETPVIAGTGSQLTNLSRWGDYSAMTVDPSDDATFWYTAEYMKTNGTFNWNTRVVSFKINSCQ